MSRRRRGVFGCHGDLRGRKRWRQARLFRGGQWRRQAARDGQGWQAPCYELGTARRSRSRALGWRWRFTPRRVRYCFERPGWRGAHRRRWRHGTASRRRWWWARSSRTLRRAVVQRSRGRTRIPIPSHRALGISPMFERRKCCTGSSRVDSPFFKARTASAPHFEFCSGSIPFTRIYSPVAQKSLTSRRTPRP